MKKKKYDDDEQRSKNENLPLAFVYSYLQLDILGTTWSSSSSNGRKKNTQDMTT